MKQTKTTKIALVSLLTALSVVLGYFLKIPTPTGILTLLDAGVFFAAFYFDEWLGCSPTRNPTKFHAKYGRDDCRNYS